MINNLINEKLKVQLIDVYSNNNTLSEKNILMKKIFEEVENKINEKQAEKKLDFEIESLSKSNYDKFIIYLNYLIFR
jgi:hypothetical protein